MDVFEINYYLIVHVKHVLNIHAFLLIVDKQVTIVKLRLQNTNFKYLPYFHNNTDRLKKKLTIIRILHEKYDKFAHRRLSL